MLRDDSFTRCDSHHCRSPPSQPGFPLQTPVLDSGWSQLGTDTPSASREGLGLTSSWPFAAWIWICLHPWGRLVPVFSVFISCPRLSNYPNLKNLPFALKHTRTFLVPGFSPCCSICPETCDPCSCLSWFISCPSGLWLVLPPPLILLARVSSPSFSLSHHSALDNIDFSLQWSWLLMHSLADLSLPLEYHLLKCRDFSACSQLHAGVKSQCLGQSTDSMNVSWVNKWMKICTDENAPISNWGSPSNAFQVGRHDAKGTYTIHHLRKVPQIFHWATLRADKFSCQWLFLHRSLLLS